MGPKGPLGPPDPPVAGSGQPPQPRTPHPTCHFPPLLSQTPGPPFSSFACSPRVPRPQGRSLPLRLALAAGLASSGLARCLHARGPPRGPRAADAASAPGGPPCPQRPSEARRTRSQEPTRRAKAAPAGKHPPASAGSAPSGVWLSRKRKWGLCVGGLGRLGGAQQAEGPRARATLG